MTENKTISVDIVLDSIDHVVAISFPKSRSAGYSAAVNIARKAAKYGEMEMSGALFHYAAFSRNMDQAALALAIVRYLNGIRAVQIYAGGKMLLEHARVDSVLSCYLEACACNNHLAHCNKVVADVFDRESGGYFTSSKSYLFPCAFLMQWGRLGLQREHPANSVDQIQAMAVKKGCDWCPNFKPGDFKKL